MFHMLDNDLLEFISTVAANNTAEQIEQAEREADGDEIQEQSFALLKQFVEQRKQQA